MANFGKFMAIVLGIIISPIINGFVFSKLWVWFIVSTFQIQPLRVVEAIGIIFVLNFVFSKRIQQTGEFWENFISDIIFIVLTGGFALLSGWILTFFF
jgi:hypothetical protein